MSSLASQSRWRTVRVETPSTSTGSRATDVALATRRSGFAIEHLLVALLGRAVDLEAQEELGHHVDPARRRHPLLHFLVCFVAAHLRQVVADQLVVLDDGAPVGADVSAAELLRPARVLVAEGPAPDDG